MTSARLRLAFAWVVLAATGCGDDEGQNEADRIGVAADCISDEDCPNGYRGQTAVDLTCLLDFKGGYCGIVGCRRDADCPDASACIVHTDGNNYCFHTCDEKVECNVNRARDNEASCSSSVTFIEEGPKIKACVPPSSSN